MAFAPDAISAHSLHHHHIWNGGRGRNLGDRRSAANAVDGSVVGPRVVFRVGHRNCAPRRDSCSVPWPGTLILRMFFGDSDSARVGTLSVLPLLRRRRNLAVFHSTASAAASRNVRRLHQDEVTGAIATGS